MTPHNRGFFGGKNSLWQALIRTTAPDHSGVLIKLKIIYRVDSINWTSNQLCRSHLRRRPDAAVSPTRCVEHTKQTSPTDALWRPDVGRWLTIGWVCLSFSLSPNWYFLLQRNSQNIFWSVELNCRKTTGFLSLWKNTVNTTNAHRETKVTLWLCWGTIQYQTWVNCDEEWCL